MPARAFGASYSGGYPKSDYAALSVFNSFLRRRRVWRMIGLPLFRFRIPAYFPERHMARIKLLSRNMCIYRHDEFTAEWEPDPWTMAASAADAQRREFHRRALMPIKWLPVPWKCFPGDGIFGHQKDWFVSAQVEFIASSGGEDLLLIENVWFGWPDPPQWGLASRPSGRSGIAWVRWGNFADLPAAWQVPDHPRR